MDPQITMSEPQGKVEKSLKIQRLDFQKSPCLQWNHPSCNYVQLPVVEPSGEKKQMLPMWHGLCSMKPQGQMVYSYLLFDVESMVKTSKGNRHTSVVYQDYLQKQTLKVSISRVRAPSCSSERQYFGGLKATWAHTQDQMI